MPKIINAIEYLKAQEAAELLSVPVNTLATWRMKGSPSIPYLKLGRTIYYKKEDILLFLKNSHKG